MGSVGGALTASHSTHAQDDPPTKATCARAYESAQESRAAGQLQETQTRLSVCARSECPSFVQKDCARWLEEVEHELPSVILEARGLDAESARQLGVTIDDRPIPDALGGGPISLDPGRHELVAESPSGARVTRVIVAQQGVQNRVVRLDVGPEQRSLAATDVAFDTGSGASPLRPYAYVAWGLGAIGLGTFAVLGTLGRADERALRDDCPEVTDDPSLLTRGVCLDATWQERRDTYQREFVLADIGLVTGLAGMAAGTVLFILTASDDDSAVSPSDEAALHFDASPLPGGGYASVGGAF